MKKLLSLALILTMFACGITAVSATDTDAADETTLPVTEYIDNWDFDSAADAPTEAFQALPENVTTDDGITAGKFDAYTNEKNTGFISSSWKNVTDDYIVFDLRIKADKKTIKTMHILDANQMTYTGDTLYVRGFNALSLTADAWNKIALVLDMSEKTVDGDKVSNIKPVVLVVNGKKYSPANTNTISITKRRNFIEPQKTDDVWQQTGDIVYMDYYKTYTTTEAAVTELITDRETYLVRKYIDNWDFSDGSQPTASWQTLPTFSNGIATFNTYSSEKHPCFNGQVIANYVDGTNKFLVLEFSVKADKQTSDQLRIWNNVLCFKGTSLAVPGFGTITLDTGKWHNVVYVMNLENATVSDGSVINIKPYLMYIDSDKYKPGNNATVTFNNSNSHRTWIQKTSNNNTEAAADIVYMDYYKTYIADSTEVEADATYLNSVTKYTPVNKIVDRDFDYKGDISTSSQGSLPVMTTVDGRGVVEFNSNNTSKEDGTYGNIGFYDDIKFANMTEDYVVLETGFKYGGADAKSIVLFGGMIRILNNGTEANLRVMSDTGNYELGIDRNVWYDVSLVIDRSTFAEDGILKAVKLTVGESEFNLVPKSITWKSPNKDKNANVVYMESTAADIMFWLDCYKAYTVAADAFAFGGTSKYTMKDLIYSYEFDVKAGNKFNNGDREAVTLEDGTKAVKLTACSGATQKNAGFEIYAGDGTGTVVVETKVMIPENDGASSYCLANIIELKAKTASEETGDDTLSVSLYGGDRDIAEDLKFGAWHTFEVVIDNENKRYLTLTIDGTKYDIANGFRATANNSNITRYYVEGKTDATLPEAKSHVMYMDYMKSYKINDFLAAPEYTNAEGAAVTAITPGEPINVSIDVNTEIKDVTESVMAALYSGNKLISVTKGAYDADTGKVTAAVEVPSGISGAAVKVLGWNGMNTLKPIMAYDVFPKE